MAWLSTQRSRYLRLSLGSPGVPGPALARMQLGASTVPAGYGKSANVGVARCTTAGMSGVRLGAALGVPGARYGVTGVVKEMGDKRARVVRAYRQDTGELLGSQMAVGGVFSLSWIGYNGPVTVLAYDDVAGVVYNAQVFDSVTPV